MKSQRAKNAVRKLLMSIFFLECIGMTSVYSQVHEAIKPHVDFLSHKQLSAKVSILFSAMTILSAVFQPIK